MEVTKLFSFEAAHSLPDYHGAHEQIHGHTYQLEVTVEGELQANGIVLDFMILDALVQRRILDIVHHRNLNDIFKCPSTELVTQWMWSQLSPLSSLLSEESTKTEMPEKIQHILGNRRGKKDINTEVKLKRIRLWEGRDACVTME
jgi:6-pyruvoyltetrahydropterin/6-carboxytetrahydropterin synthase